MIESTNYGIQTQRQALAEGLGLGAKNTAHTEAVFGRLEALQKKEGVLMKKSSSVFNSKLVIDDNVRATILMCYGRAAF